ncbi:MAG: PQQ-binding-like beta-propeller repeat protein, partial [Steroidobacteraceae bacterium]
MRPRIALRGVSAVLAFAGVALANVSARAAEALAFSDIAGWWTAEPTFAGESSRVVLHFLEENGKQSARLSLLGIGGYDVPIGTVTITGMALDMEPFSFALRFDPQRQTLSGHLPEAAVPVYKIPVEFRRTEPLAKPTPPAWNHPRPRVKWTYETGAPVWAGIERDASSGLIFVANDAGAVHAIDAEGKASWTFATGKPIKARPAAIGDGVYVASDAGFLYKLDKRNGTERWRAKIDTGSPDRIPTDQPKTRWDRYGSSVVADGKRLFVASRDNNLYALDVASGKELWRVQASDLMTATPALYKDTVLFADYKGIVQAVGAADGKVRWTFDARLPV